MKREIIMLFGLIFLCHFSGIGQETDTKVKTFIDENGDTITQYLDSKNRVTEQYVNFLIDKIIKYQHQDSVVLAKLTVKVGQLTRPEFEYQLKEGDTVTIHVCSRKAQKRKKKKQHKRGRKIKQIDFTEGKKGNRFSEVKVYRVNWKDLIEDSGKFKLKIHNMVSLLARYVDVKVVRFPKDSMIVTNYVRDTFSLMDSTAHFTFDTLLLPVLEESIYLPPQRDFENNSFRIIKFETPIPLNKMGDWSYWIGVGEESKNNYQKLVETVPDNWSKPGVTKPLGAYSLGANLSLVSPLNKNIGIKFGDSTQMLRLMRSLTPTKFKTLNTPYVGRNKALPMTKNQTNYVLIANQDPVNGYSIDLKIIARRIDATKTFVPFEKRVIGKPRPDSEKINKKLPD